MVESFSRDALITSVSSLLDRLVDLSTASLGALCAAGLLLAFFGSGRLFRLLAPALCGAVMYAVLPTVFVGFGVASVKPLFLWSIIGFFALLSLALPRLAVFVSVGLPAGALVADLQLFAWPPAFLLTTLLAGTAAVLWWHPFAAVTSAATGSTVSCFAGLALMCSVQYGNGCAPGSPRWLVWLAVALTTAAGTIFQLVFWGSPQRRAGKKISKQEAQRKAQEEFARLRRWASTYNKQPPS